MSVVQINATVQDATFIDGFIDSTVGIFTGDFTSVTATLRDLVGALISRLLFRFPLGSIPAGSTITAAKLTLNFTSVGGVARTYSIRRLTQEFTAGATYDKFDGVTVWPGGDGAAGDTEAAGENTGNLPTIAGLTTFDTLATIVANAFAGDGVCRLLMRRTTTSTGTWAITSIEGGGGLAPVLEVEFTNPVKVVGAPPTLAQVFASSAVDIDDNTTVVTPSTTWVAGRDVLVLVSAYDTSEADLVPVGVSGPNGAFTLIVTKNVTIVGGGNFLQVSLWKRHNPTGGAEVFTATFTGGISTLKIIAFDVAGAAPNISGNVASVNFLDTAAPSLALAGGPNSSLVFVSTSEPDGGVPNLVELFATFTQGTAVIHMRKSTGSDTFQITAGPGTMDTAIIAAEIEGLEAGEGGGGGYFAASHFGLVQPSIAG